MSETLEMRKLRIIKNVANALTWNELPEVLEREAKMLRAEEKGD
jgi:hypothetical protein